MRKLQIPALTLILLSSTVSANELCELPHDGTPTIVIDSNTGKVNSGQLSYNEFMPIRVVFSNQNPFAHQYQFDIASERLETAIIQTALQAILGSNAGQKNVPETATESVMPEPIGEKYQDLKLKTSALESNIENYRYLLEQAKKHTECKAIIDTSQNLKTEIEAITEYITSYNELEHEVRNELSAITDEALKIPYKRLLASSRMTVDELLKESGVFKENLTLIEKIMSEPKALYTVKTLRAPEEPTRHKIVVSTWPIGESDNKKDYNVEVNVGQSRFSYSVGLALGKMEQHSYGVREHNSAISGDNTGKYVALIDDASQQFGVIGQLNTRLYQWNSGQTFLWSLGASLNPDSESNNPNFGFYTGPSIAFLDDKFVVTLGYHLYKKKMPLAGYKQGSKLPDDFSGDIPLKSQTEKGWLLGFSWQFE